jgi:hypothetical protein
LTSTLLNCLPSLRLVSRRRTWLFTYRTDARFAYLLQYGCSVHTIYRRRRDLGETRRCDDEELFSTVQDMEERHKEGEAVFDRVCRGTL